MKSQDQNRGIKSAAAVQDIDRIWEGDSPLTHTIGVGWGDCDPAQIAYTANVPGWNLEALEAWYKQCLGGNWFELNLDNGIGTPFVKLNVEFHAPITPRSDLQCRVYVEKIGNTSLSHHVEGSQSNRLCYTGTSTSVFVNASTFEPIKILTNMGHSIRHYASAQGRDFIDSSRA